MTRAGSGVDQTKKVACGLIPHATMKQSELLAPADG